MKKAALAAAVAVLSLGVAAWAYWSFALAPSFYFGKARDHQMRRLGDAVARFNADQNRLPRSIDELVSAGALPASTPLCYNPMKHGRLRTEPVAASACEFDLRFSTSEVVISLPADVASLPRYSATGAAKARIVIGAGLKAAR